MSTLAKCPECSEVVDPVDTICPHCGVDIVSVEDDMLDALVQQASKPTLASLFKAGQAKGYIQPTHEYSPMG